MGAAMIAASCTGAATPAPTTAPTDPPAPTTGPTEAPTLGTPEKTSVSIGYRLPSLNSVAPLLIAQDKGYWKDCGLDTVALIQTEEVQAGVISGSLDIGLVETVDFGDAELRGLPMKLIAGYRPYSRNVIAVRPEITSPADLAGKDILLGGTPGTRDFDVRLGYLKDAGYDLTGVAYNPVSVEGGSDAWVALLLDGKLFMTPIFNRHYNRLKEAGMQFWVDSQDFGSDHVAISTDLLAKQPNTTAAILCGLIQGIQDWSDPANKDYVLGLGAATGIEITDGIRNAYELDIANYKPFDGGPGPYDEMQALFDDNLEGTVNLASLIDLGALHKAQAYLGLPQSPSP